jgi:hypothetical protein
MLIQKTGAVGIDRHVQLLQSDVHGKLLTKWGIDTATYESYGRVSRNKTADGYIAEVFTGNATLGETDYKEVYWNDLLSAISFFTVADRVEVDQMHKVDVGLIFFVNVQKLKPTITHRADEEVRIDVVNAVGKYSYGFEYTGYETGIDNVLREYPGSRKSEGLKAVDMQPVHSFRINFSLVYNPNKNC